jgi:excisionase family DNA binding protein
VIRGHSITITKTHFWQWGIDLMHDKPFFSTKEVAEFLDINEKLVYTLISEKGLPATKVTGKWLFPRRLVEQWVETHIINYPKSDRLAPSHGMIVFAGSHDIFLERVIGLFNQRYPEHLAVFGNIGSQGGIEALSRGLCHVASSHLLQDDEEEYNFDFVIQELRGELAAVVNLCRREQGILIAKGNPKGIHTIADLEQADVKIANRPVGTGTRLLFDRELRKAGLTGKQIKGYNQEFRSHLDVAVEVHSGRADAAPAIRPVADLLDLDFVSLRWERYDLLISRKRFFEQGVQLFLNLLHEPSVSKLIQDLRGYDLSLCGRMIFSHRAELHEGEKS